MTIHNLKIIIDSAINTYNNLSATEKQDTSLNYAAQALIGAKSNIDHYIANQPSPPQTVSLSTSVNTAIQKWQAMLNNSEPLKFDATHLTVNDDAGKLVFKLNPDGTIFADWSALKDMKDKLFANTHQSQAYAMAAAIWIARNSM